MFWLVNDKLFTHLFTILVLITGTLCESAVSLTGHESEGGKQTIKCYVCSADECGGHANLKTHVKDCTGYHPACEISTAGGLPDRRCKENFGEWRFSCIRHDFSENSCSTYKSNVSDTFRKCNDAVNKVVDHQEGYYKDYDKPSTANYCACRKDLCNAGHEPVSAACTHFTFNTIPLSILITLHLI